MERRVPEGTGRRATRRIPRRWAVLTVAFFAYTTFRLVEMTWWLIRALVR